MPRTKKTTTTEFVVMPPRKKPGPKPKPPSERVYKPAKPIQRVENSYTQRRKEEVLLYLLNHTIYDPDSWKSVNCYRKPFQRDASRHFKIPEATIHTWWKNRTSILNREKKPRKKKGAKDQHVPDAGETAPPETPEESEASSSEQADQESTVPDPATVDKVNPKSSEIQDE